MGEEIPRRMRRFYRKDTARGLAPDWSESVASQIRAGEEKAPDSDVTMQLALDEVERFKKRHNRFPKKEEYEGIAESIYAQLKDKETKERAMRVVKRKEEKAAERELRRAERPERPRERGKRGGKRVESVKRETAFAEMQAAARGLGDEEIKEMSVEDLFSSEKKKPAEKVSEDEFSLGGLTGLEGQREEIPNKCPNCGLPADQLVFCPGCGTAFCESCAKSVERKGKLTVFVCPGCGKKVKR